jgi:phage tail-like protein
MSTRTPTPPPVGSIEVRLGGEVVQTIPLTGEVLTIGRTPHTTISLSHPIVSRRHAEIRVEPTGVILTDLGSSNGTIIDGQRLPPHQPHMLSAGQSFQVGPFLLTYRPPAPVRSADQPADVPDDRPSRLDEEEPATPDTGEPSDQPVAIDGEEREAAPETTGEPDAAAEPRRQEPPPLEVDDIEMPEEDEEFPPLVPLLEQPMFGHPPAPPRPKQLAPAPVGPRSSWLRDLPVIYHEADFLGRFLMIFESMWEPLEYRQDHISHYFDPRTAPAEFLPWLASWLDLSINTRWPESRLRNLLSEAMDLYRWRGTNYGLSRLIEVCTAGQTAVTDDPKTPYVMRIQVTLPAAGSVSDALLHDLIQTHKPAHVAYVLEVVRQ